tara:strand:- start:504 stop:1076 length:573 start_codon:yes stop_codon:yes gene_type:complete
LDKGIYSYEAKTISGKVSGFSRFRGKVLLIVNVASKCGFTSQYEGLQELYEKYGDRGLSILAFPSNDFGSQEPGSNEQINSFCQSSYQVTFDLFSKVSVLGSEKITLYQYLYNCALEPKGGGGLRSRFLGLVKWLLYRKKGMLIPGIYEAQWNFHKFLVDKNGIPVASFLSEVPPDSPILIQKLEEELQK